VRVLPDRAAGFDAQPRNPLGANRLRRLVQPRDLGLGKLAR